MFSDSAELDSNISLFNLKHLTIGFHLGLALGLKILLQFCKAFVSVAQNGFLDCLGALLELGTKGLLVDLDLPLFYSARFGKLFADNKLLLCADRMDSQVVCRSIGTADALDPALE